MVTFPDVGISRLTKHFYTYIYIKALWFCMSKISVLFMFREEHNTSSCVFLCVEEAAISKKTMNEEK